MKDVKYISTNEMMTDIMMKLLPKVKFEISRNLIHLMTDSTTKWEICQRDLVIESFFSRELQPDASSKHRFSYSTLELPLFIADKRATKD